jgi:protein-S-isoprenylcysteine O-methyltransferase Ste14
MLQPARSREVRAATLDAVEKYILAVVFVYFAWRMVTAFLQTGSPVTLIYLADQLLVLVFIMIRRPPKDISQRIDDWVVGFAGTLLALLIGPPGPDALVPATIVTALLALGFAVHVAAKLSLRRSFGVVAANRGVKATGPYRVVRHPMYLGYILSQTGLWLAGPTVVNSVVIAGCWTLYVLRIVAEERILMRDDAYASFAARTRYRLVPGIY